MQLNEVRRADWVSEVEIGPRGEHGIKGRKVRRVRITVATGDVSDQADAGWERQLVEVVPGRRGDRPCFNAAAPEPAKLPDGLDVVLPRHRVAPQARSEGIAQFVAGAQRGSRLVEGRVCVLVAKVVEVRVPVWQPGQGVDGVYAPQREVGVGNIVEHAGAIHHRLGPTPSTDQSPSRNRSRGASNERRR